MFNKLRGLKAVSGKEVRAKTPRRGALNLNQYDEAVELERAKSENKSIGRLPQGLNMPGSNKNPANENSKERAQTELKEAEFNGVVRATELAKKAGVEESHGKIRDVEARYADLYKKFYAPDNALFRTKHRKEFFDVSKKYEGAQLKHVAALQESVERRLDTPERNEKLQKKYNALLAGINTSELHGGLRDASGRVLTFEAYKKQEDQNLLKRYNGWIRYNEVFKQRVDVEQKARVENLDDKGKGLFTKAIEGYAKANQKARREIWKEHCSSSASSNNYRHCNWHSDTVWSYWSWRHCCLRKL